MSNIDLQEVTKQALLSELDEAKQLDVNDFNFDVSMNITIMQGYMEAAKETLEELLNKFSKSSSNIIDMKFEIK